jgi:hypothetical protein
MFSTILNGLKFPLKLLVGLVRNRRRDAKKAELEKKCRQHVRNFAPRHCSWQVRSGKKLTKKQKEYYKNRSKRISKRNYKRGYE